MYPVTTPEQCVSAGGAGVAREWRCGDAGVAVVPGMK